MGAFFFVFFQRGSAMKSLGTTDLEDTLLKLRGAMNPR